MGIFHTIALKIDGQIKSCELGEEIERQIKSICKRHNLDILEDKSGCCSSGFDDYKEE